MSADNQNYTRSQRSDVHGSVSGHSITLKLDSFLGYGCKEADGEFNDGKLVLEFPSSNGRVNRYTLTPTTSTAWNRAVSRFEAHWKSLIDKQRALSAKVALQQSIRTEGAKALNDVYESQKDLAVNLMNLDAFRQQLAQAKQALQARKEDVKRADEIATKAEKEASTDQEKYQAGKLRYQVGQAEYQVGTAQYQVDSWKSRVNAVLDTIEGEKNRIRKILQRVKDLFTEERTLSNNHLPDSLLFDVGKYVAQVVMPARKMSIV